MFRGSNKILVEGNRAGPKKLEIALRRYLVMLLTVVTFIPVSNLVTAKAVDEHNYSLNVTIDLNGGDSTEIFYMSNVDRTGCGYTGGQWVQKLGIGKTFLDRHGSANTIQNRGADSPCVGSFTVRADAVGITPYVVVSTPTRSGYTFTGWSTNTGTAEYGGNTAFEIGAYAPDNITITATWSRNEPDTASMTVSWDSGVSYVGADGYSSDYDFTYSGQSHNFPYNSRLQTNVHLKDGYSIVGFQEGSTLWTDYWTNADYPGIVFDSWGMYDNRSIKVITKPNTYTIKYYIRNQQADGTWGDYWYWTSESKTYGSTYHIDGYGNDSNGPDNATYQNFCVSGTVDGDKDVYIDAYRRKYTINYYVRNENADGTWGNYWYWYSEEKLYESTYHADGYGNDSNGPDNATYQNFCVSGTVQGNKDVYIDAYRRKYTLYFNYNKPDNASGTINKNVDNKEMRYEEIAGNLPVPTLTGWTFAGWYTMADGGTEVKSADTFSWTNDITLYAHWIENTYTIHYDSNGGIAINDVDVKYEDSVKLYAMPYRPGYNFSYWNTKADGSGYSYEASETIRHLATSGIVNIYAIYDKKSLMKVGVAVNTAINNGYIFGQISDESVISIRSYLIDENGDIQHR